MRVKMTKLEIIDGIRIGLRKERNEDGVKRECPQMEGIEEYLYILYPFSKQMHGISEVSSDMLSDLSNEGLSEDALWKFAERNTFAETSIDSIDELMIQIGVVSETSNMRSNLYRISNTRKHLGASAILNKIALRDFCHFFENPKIVVIPSSIHECLITPYFEGIDIDETSELVRSVNNNDIPEGDVLSDRAYVLTID